MAYSIYNIHFVFRTKCSRRTVTPEHAGALYAYIDQLTRQMHCQVLAINSMPDHIHIAASLTPKVSPAEYMRQVKGGTSKWMSQQRCLFPYFEGWARSYFMAVATKELLPTICRYIKNQQVHHAQHTFREEMEHFFRLAGMEDKLPFFLRDEISHNHAPE